jgi:hypothetical protein
MGNEIPTLKVRMNIMLSHFNLSLHNHCATLRLPQSPGLVATSSRTVCALGFKAYC